MEASLTVSPTADPNRVRTADGRILTPPADWSLVPPGDAALTRRVKTAGPSWTVVEKKGRKTFSHGVWAPTNLISTFRKQLEEERADPRHARRQEAALRRRQAVQVEYVEDFGEAVRSFLAFAPVYADLARFVSEAVTVHATPVGSGTVARTKRIPLEERVEAAVIAWLRHATTAYDHMVIPRVRGRRREVRRQLARQSRQLLDLHRVDRPHPAAECPLCRTAAEVGG